MTYIFPLFALLLTIFSYGFIDPNLPYSSSKNFKSIQNVLAAIVYEDRLWAGVIYVILLIGLYGVYIYLLRNAKTSVSPNHIYKVIALIAVILFLAFPAFSYDIFNYMTTAKVVFYHAENPYLVMPIEIPNEPWLSFTRAANKVALYGPVWILLTWLPFISGGGNIPLTIFMFKLIPLAGYVLMMYLIRVMTKDIRNVIFFCLHPLVLIEVLVSSHNDIVMMVLAVTGLLFVQRKTLKEKIMGVCMFAMSILIKGATVVLTPMLFSKRFTKIPPYILGFLLMLGVFFLTPLREELYPWYAVWFLVFAALLPWKKDSLIHWFSVFFGFGLSMRHLPYILTREYGGTGPMLRLIVTVVPPAVYLLIRFFMNTRRKYRHGY